MSAKTKKKKWIPMAALGAVIVVFGVGYVLLSGANEKKAAEEAAAANASSAVTMIAEYDSANVKTIMYKLADADPVELENDGGVWRLSADPNFPVNQTIVGSMAGAVSSIGVKSSLADGDAAEFGLEEPAYLIRVTYEDGTAHEYRVGDYNSFAGGAYYFMADGAIYTISSGLTGYFDYDAAALLQNETMPTDIEQDYITGITVKTQDGENLITDANGIASLFDFFGDIRLNNCADYYADDAERAEYGIDGTRSITIAYKRAVTNTDSEGNESTARLETSFTFDFGDPSGHDEGYYGAKEGSTMVYVIDKETADKILAYVDYIPEESEPAEVTEP